MTKNPINWFEIPVKNLGRAASFYEKVLQCKLSIQDFGDLKMAWFPASRDAPGSAGSLVEQESYVPSHQGSMVYFSVENIEDSLSTVVANGGKILNPKRNIGEFGYVAHFEDSEGNRVALHSDH
jgi:predicted enzyme related to lactoylglutathione lyase